MRREAHFREDLFSKGRWCDTYVYAVLSSDRADGDQAT
jgi:RimJ/RimL family protein N-acetyltransferase